MKQKRKLGEMRPCLECGVGFRPRVDLLKRGMGKYCSTRCSGDARQPCKVKAEEIIRMYVEDNMTMKQIAGATGMGWRSVQSRIKNANVPINPYKRKKGDRPKIAGKHIYAYVVESKYNRAMEPGERVHHVDFNLQNNQPENLVIVSMSQHSKLHWQLTKLAVELVKKGEIVFSEEEMKYMWK